MTTNKDIEMIRQSFRPQKFEYYLLENHHQLV